MRAIPASTHVLERTALRAFKSCRFYQPIAVSPDELALVANVSRYLEGELVLSFVHAWTRELYVKRGRPSIASIDL